jgi:hypothetical protein
MFKEKIKVVFRNLLVLTTAFTFFNCSSDKSTEPPPPTAVKVTVKSAIDSSIIAGANVVLYNANSGEAVLRVSSGADGTAEFNNLTEGSFYVRIAAQGFKELPIGNVSPIPFSVSTWQTYTQTYFLDTLQGTFGKIDGSITPAQSGFLVVAASTLSVTELHSYSGPDGYFALFNVPFDTYQLYAVKSGYISSVNPQVTISAQSQYSTIQLTMNQVQGSTLTGMVTFLAATNGIVDISLLDKNSLSVISGLTTRIDSSRNYVISNIPVGEYIAWASYENDGYVMDPDWIFKNPGALDLSFTSDINAALDFSVTDAITIISPTNPDETIIPAIADSIIPTFRWDMYPQAKEYIIEVRDINGNLIWGGFDSNGIVRHTQIPRERTSAEFNFDGSALTQLQQGQIYQWKIYADDDAALNVQTLLSSSEDQKGLFVIP